MEAFCSRARDADFGFVDMQNFHCGHCSCQVGEEPVAMLADDCEPMWTCPLGVHQIEELPPQEQIPLLPPAQTRNDSPSQEMILSNGGRGLPTDEGREDDDGSWNKSVMGMPNYCPAGNFLYLL